MKVVAPREWRQFEGAVYLEGGGLEQQAQKEKKPRSWGESGVRVKSRKVGIRKKKKRKERLRLVSRRGGVNEKEKERRPR